MANSRTTLPIQTRTESFLPSGTFMLSIPDTNFTGANIRLEKDEARELIKVVQAQLDSYESVCPDPKLSVLEDYEEAFPGMTVQPFEPGKGLKNELWTKTPEGVWAHSSSVKDDNGAVTDFYDPSTTKTDADMAAFESQIVSWNTHLTESDVSATVKTEEPSPVEAADPGEPAAEVSGDPTAPEEPQVMEGEEETNA